MQDPKSMVPFFAKDLVWAEIKQTNGGIDRVSKIPSNRVFDFIRGEEMNPAASCSFIRKINKQPGQWASASLRYEM